MKMRLIAGLLLGLVFVTAARADDPPAVLAADPADREIGRAHV